MVNFVTYFDSELYAEPDQDFLTSSLNNAKGILPIDPFGSGGDWFTTVPEMVIPGT